MKIQWWAGIGIDSDGKITRYARRIGEEGLHPVEQGRFWVMGPVDMDGDRKRMMWGVVDGHDRTGQRPARKPPGFQEFWPTEAEANAHRDALNKDYKL